VTLGENNNKANMDYLNGKFKNKVKKINEVDENGIVFKSFKSISDMSKKLNIPYNKAKTIVASKRAYNHLFYIALNNND